MHSENPHRWVAQADELTPSQRQQAIDRLRHEPRPMEVLGQTLDPEPACPYCHHAECAHWGNTHGLARYRCPACHKTFNALTGTPLARLHHGESWPTYAEALIEATTVREAARRCDHRMATSKNLSPSARRKGDLEVAFRILSTAILRTRDRSAHTTDAVLAKADTLSVRPVLEPVIDPDAMLCSDGNAIYRRLAEQLGLVHKPISRHPLGGPRFPHP